MKKISIENLKPGMVLAKPVKNFHNILLLKEQSEIKDKSISMLKSWGILSVWVVGEDKEEETRNTEIDKAALASLNREMLKKFSEVADDPVMVEIMRVAGEILEEKVLS